MLISLLFHVCHREKDCKVVVKPYLNDAIDANGGSGAVSVVEEERQFGGECNISHADDYMDVDSNVHDDEHTRGSIVDTASRNGESYCAVLSRETSEWLRPLLIGLGFADGCELGVSRVVPRRDGEEDMSHHRYEDDKYRFMKRKSRARPTWMADAAKHKIQWTLVRI